MDDELPDAPAFARPPARPEPHVRQPPTRGVWRPRYQPLPPPLGRAGHTEQRSGLSTIAMVVLLIAIAFVLVHPPWLSQEPKLWIAPSPFVSADEPHFPIHEVVAVLVVLLLFVVLNKKST